ncbi:hypothetical protein EB796_018310 [Bugula neritina]|uniref:PHOSPHO2 n=1 Tax=Bugula neritina TaxID=10212 RepID=A0A7J7JBS8_BUGNE|nr:hypothetical protein EB796_018310 [Bugula neritina]
MMAKPQKILLAFDFDHTILDGNSDVQVQKLHNGPLPDAVTKLYSGRDWNHYMAAVFDLLHRQNISAEDIRQNILSLSLVSGMKELFDHLRQDMFEVIIISDANYQFIDWHLRENQFDEFIAQIYSNPAKFDENGKLNLEFYHRQNWCDLCSKNLCKGSVLEKHVAQRKSSGTSYSRIFYIGDGNNDYCPSLRLAEKDCVFPRIGYALHRRIQENTSKVKAQVVPWKTASTIMEAVTSST